MPVKILQSVIENNGCVFALKGISSYLFLSDYDRCHADFFVLDDLDKIQDLIVILSEIEIMIIVFLLC